MAFPSPASNFCITWRAAAAGWNYSNIGAPPQRDVPTTVPTPMRQRSRGRQAIIALDAVRRTETHVNAGRMLVLVPVVLAGVELATTAATNVRWWFISLDRK